MNKKQKIKQKLYGIVLIILGVVSVPLCDNDATAAVMIVPLGVGVFLTKEKVVD